MEQRIRLTRPTLGKGFQDMAIETMRERISIRELCCERDPVRLAPAQLPQFPNRRADSVKEGWGGVVIVYLAGPL